MVPKAGLYPVGFLYPTRGSLPATGGGGGGMGSFLQQKQLKKERAQ